MNQKAKILILLSIEWQVPWPTYHLFSDWKLFSMEYNVIENFTLAFFDWTSVRQMIVDISSPTFFYCFEGIWPLVELVSVIRSTQNGSQTCHWKVESDGSSRDEENNISKVTTSWTRWHWIILMDYAAVMDVFFCFIALVSFPTLANGHLIAYLREFGHCRVRTSVMINSFGIPFYMWLLCHSVW
jgi:hypothetical protein